MVTEEAEPQEMATEEAGDTLMIH